jgi:hypothetical protein
MTGPNQPREGEDAVGDVGAVEGRVGLDGVTGLAGDGRAGVEYEREPRLPPLPARASMAPASVVSARVSASPSVQRSVDDVRLISPPPPAF